MVIYLSFINNYTLNIQEKFNDEGIGEFSI